MGHTKTKGEEPLSPWYAEKPQRHKVVAIFSKQKRKTGRIFPPPQRAKENGNDSPLPFSITVIKEK